VGDSGYYGGGTGVDVIPPRPVTVTATPVAPMIVQAAPVVSVPPVLDNNLSVSVYGKVIPISAGERRVPGDLIWLESDQLNTEGEYTAHAAFGFGYRLIEGATSTLTKLWANGQVMYDITTGFVAEGFSLEAEYDGSQTTYDSEIAADKGASITPAYKEQLYIRTLLPTKEFAATIPNISALWTDDAGGTLFRAWGGTWDFNARSTDIDLSNGDLTADNNGGGAGGGPQGSVLSTEGHSGGRWTFGLDPAAITPTGFGIALAMADANLDHYLGSQDNKSWRWDADGSVYIGAVFAGTWVGYTASDNVAVLLDADANLVWGMKNGTPVSFFGSGATPTADDIADGIGGFDISSIVTGPIFAAVTLGVNSDSATGNFDDPAFIQQIGVPGALSLMDVILAVARRCGLTSANFDFVGLDDILVTGIVITSDVDFRSFLQNAGRTYGFDYTESGGRILCKKSVLASAYTINHTFLPTYLLPIDDDTGVQTIRADTSQYPTVIELKYQDETIDYQPSMQRARREEARVHITDSFSVPFVMNATEALTAATTALFRDWQQRTTHNLALPFLGLNVEPTDLIEFDADGRTYTAKVTNVVRKSDLTISLSCVNLLTVEAESLTDGEYAGGGMSGDPNIGNLPLEIGTGSPKLLWPWMTLTY